MHIYYLDEWATKHRHIGNLGQWVPCSYPILNPKFPHNLITSYNSLHMNVDDLGNPQRSKVETPIHDNDLILTPIIALQSG